MAYEPRLYRASMGAGRFSVFQIEEGETDLWIGIDPGCRKVSGSAALRAFTSEHIRALRRELLAFAEAYPEFLTAHEPPAAERYPTELPKGAERLLLAGRRGGTGPMAGVAGLFAEYIGLALIEEFGCREIVVENGGDLFISAARPLTFSIYAGDSPLSEAVLITIPETASPLGVCTSSGTVGHSFSYGRADAVMIACADTVLADVYATAFANRITSPQDLSPVSEELKSRKEILSAVLIAEDKAALYGNFPVSFSRPGSSAENRRS